MPHSTCLPEPEVTRAQLREANGMPTIRRSKAYQLGYKSAASCGNYNQQFFSPSYTQQYRIGYLEYCESHHCIGRSLFDTELPAKGDTQR